MAREHAQVRLDLWNDDDFRILTRAAQLLYIQLLTSATLNYAGVADWRPKRIAPLSGDGSPGAVEDAAEELEAGLFIITDADTEEVLIRSFLKHDGLLQKPNVTKAMLAGFGAISSPTLRGVIVHELRKLSVNFPEWRAFGMKEVRELLERDSINPSELVSKGSGKGLSKGSENDPSLLTPYSLLHDSILPSPSDAEASDEGSEEFADEVKDLCSTLADLVKANGHPVGTVGVTWWRACERLIRIDGYTVEQIDWVMRWATANEFWSSNIRSMSKLREKFSELKARALAEKQRAGRAPVTYKQSPDDAVLAILQLGGGQEGIEA